MTKKTEQKNTAVSRPPVVAVMGHIDHGKTTLLDYIRKASVAEKEAGGITQHVSAYEVLHKTSEGVTKPITFIDTPGHEAFAGVRSRGARVADIAILIVSGEDGVKPQTLEALKFIKESKLPFIVAISKMDKPSANVERVKQSLLEHEIYIEGYGGEIPCVPISAVTGAGVSDLLDMILLVADVENIQSSPEKPAEGIILEVSRSKESGVTATLIVKDGTLKKGMAVVAGQAISILRMMDNFLGKKIETAPAGTPVSITGWNEAPKTGDAFTSFPTKKDAEKYLENLETPAKQTASGHTKKEERVIVPIVIKADVSGTLEAIESELAKLATDKILPKVIVAGTGDLNESDLKILSRNPDALVFGFNVKIDSAAKSVADRDGVTIELFTVIYKLIERMQEVLATRTPKIEAAEIRGKAKIIRLFSVVKDKQIIGGKVIEGSINLGDEFKIMRRGAEIGSGKIRELQQQKVKASEVIKDREFGAMAEAKIEIAPGDVLETFVIVKK
ncbi:MAG: Translation initiation factor IF-2 protein [Parcubacteria group bacterium GW2011_GWA2_47_16]|nr:MAG: Translation initiation factor IF-2 protein [Parcubacteria group bacterium GW2011_GWA2_47_16]